MGGAKVLLAAVETEASQATRTALLNEAESMLLASYQELQDSENIQPEYRSSRVRQAMERLVQLHRVRGDLEPSVVASRSLADWEARLARFNQALGNDENPDWREQSLFHAGQRR
jgi:hypothetical protein